MTRILIVEDEPFVRMAASDFLEMSGFDVVEACTGDDAMELLRRTEFDLVFTDVRMPGSTDGFALAKWMRGYCPNTQVVITSGDVGAKNLREDMSQHIFIPKPYSLDMIADRFREAVSVAA